MSDDSVGDPFSTPGSPVLEGLLETVRNRRHLGDRLDATGDRLDRAFLGDVVRHGPVLEALLQSPMDRGEIEAELEVSRATSHRFTQWLDEQGFARKVDSRWELTGRGEAIAEEVLRFEATVLTADRLAPLLDVICEDHQEFVVEPFLDATVTVADVGGPYRPVERFVSLARESDSFRGFNTTHMAPPVPGGATDYLFDGTDCEVIYRPAVVEKLFDAYPARATAALEAGHLTLRTREDLPYGLAIFDDCVGIGGYDDQTGQLAVFVDSEDPIAREWAERVYRSVKARSEPIDDATTGE